MKKFLVIMLLALLCFEATAKGGKGRGARGVKRVFSKGVREAEIDEDGQFLLKGKKDKNKVFSFLVHKLTELKEDGTVIEQHVSENKTSIVNGESRDTNLKFSADPSDPIPATCVLSTVTFEMETFQPTVETDCCVAGGNGSVILGEGDDEQELEIQEGYGKCSTIVKNYLWCDTAAGTGKDDCGTDVGAKLRVSYKVTGPDGDGKAAEKKERPAKQQGKKRPGQSYDFGDDAEMVSATVAATGTATAAGELANLKWINMPDDAVDVKREGGRNVARFILPRPVDPADDIYIDPVLSGGDAFDDDDDSSAPHLAATAVTITASLLATVFLY